MEWEHMMRRVFLGDGFPPRRMCGDWPTWLWVMTMAAGIWTAHTYLRVARKLSWLLNDVDAHPWIARHTRLLRAWMLVFIVCALQHVLGDVLVFYWPVYYLIGSWMCVTAVVSHWGLSKFRETVVEVLQRRQVISEIADELEKYDYDEHLEQSADYIRSIGANLRKAVGLDDTRGNPGDA